MRQAHPHKRQTGLRFEMLTKHAFLQGIFCDDLLLDCSPLFQELFQSIISKELNSDESTRVSLLTTTGKGRCLSCGQSYRIVIAVRAFFKIRLPILHYKANPILWIVLASELPVKIGAIFFNPFCHLVEIGD